MKHNISMMQTTDSTLFRREFMKNRTAKRLLSLVLIAALTMTLFVGVVSPTRAAAAEFSDVNGHWAKNSIVRWMGEDVIHGYPDGTFRPNDKITRAEFATVLKNLLRFWSLEQK